MQFLLKKWNHIIYAVPFKILTKQFYIFINYAIETVLPETIARAISLFKGQSDSTFNLI